jgi:hypothetical protein
VQAVRVPWSSASFLVYLGGFTILAGLGSLLSVQADDYGSGAFAGWALLVFLLVTLLALIARTQGRLVTAGVLALSSVGAFVVLLGAILNWFGWLAPISDSPFGGFRLSHLFLELSVVAAAAVALRIFRFPLLVLVLAAGCWFFVTDLLSGGGDGSGAVTIVVGLAFLAAAVAVDRVSRVFGFWLHVASGLTLGGGILWFLHHGDGQWLTVAAVGLLYIWLGDGLLRSSWVVLGAWGALQAAAHFAIEWAHAIPPALFVAFYLFPFAFIEAFGADIGSPDGGQPATHEWAAPLTFVVAGGLLIAIGLVIARRRSTAIPAAELL